MSALNYIRAALEGHLETTRGTSLPAVAWPNVKYDRVPGTPYLRAEFIPALRRPAAICPMPQQQQRYSGLFYVTIFVPEDQGAGQGFSYADAINAGFAASSPINTANVSVQIEYSEAKMPLHDPPFYAIPVEIGWYAYAA